MNGKVRVGVRLLLAGAVATTLLAASCSGGERQAAQRGAQRSTTTAPAPCAPKVPERVDASPVAGSTSDVDITSFDGTAIRAHWFPVGSVTAPAPTILMGPGWGSAGDTAVDAPDGPDSVGIPALHAAGYNVLTWDPRGFGASGGKAMVDSVDYEARDVQQLLTWVASQPAALVDAPGDPRAGMVGGSYGGGVQFITAAVDCRVDAIVPIIAWHSLVSSLYKNRTAKEGWATILSAAASAASLDPHITAANQRAMEHGVLSDEDVAWFAARGPGDLVKDVRVPTMIVGGTVDTLFTLDEDVTNYRMLRDAGVPVSMYWFCGGHGLCTTDPGDGHRMAERVVAWLDRWVKRDRSVDVGPRIDFLDQSGARYTSEDYPLAQGPPITATGSGTLELSGRTGPADSSAADAGIASVIVPRPATRAVDVPIPVTHDAMVLGAPTLALTYSGTTPAGERPTRVFAQIVDREHGVVVGNQITPVEVTLDGQEHEVEVPLEVISHKVGPDSRLDLQIVATSSLYALPRLGGTIAVKQATITLPTVTGYRPVA